MAESSTSERPAEAAENAGKSRLKTAKQMESVGKALEGGKTLKAALKEGGYSDAVASRGKAALSKRLLRTLSRQSLQMAELGKQIDPEQQENIVRGRLLWNVTLGKDLGTKSAELLGRDKRVNMFAADQMTGVIVLQVPQVVANPGNATLPVLEGEIIGALPDDTQE